MKKYALFFEEGLEPDWSDGDDAAEALDNYYNQPSLCGDPEVEDDWTSTTEVTAYELSVPDEELETWDEMHFDERSETLQAYVAAHPELKRTVLTVTFSSKGHEIRVA